MPCFAEAGVIGIVGTLLFAAPLKRTMRVKGTRTQPVPTALLLSSPTKFLCVPERSSRKVDRPVRDSIWGALLRLSEKGFLTIGSFVDLSRLRTQKILPRHHGDLRRQKGSVKNLRNALFGGICSSQFSSVQFQSDGLQSMFRSRRSRCKKACSLRSPVLSGARARKKKRPKHPLGEVFSSCSFVELSLTVLAPIRAP